MSRHEFQIEYRKPDQYVFGPSGSGSAIICTDPVRSTIIKQKEVRKTLISTGL
jgi:hypothetical protein